MTNAATANEAADGTDQDDVQDHPAILAFLAVGNARQLLERRQVLEREIGEIDAQIEADRRSWDSLNSPKTVEELCALIVELRGKLALAAPEAEAEERRARNERGRTQFLSVEGYDLGFDDAEAGKPEQAPRKRIKGHFYHGYVTGHRDRIKGFERRGGEAAAEYVAGLERGERRASGAQAARSLAVVGGAAEPVEPA